MCLSYLCRLVPVSPPTCTSPNHTQSHRLHQQRRSRNRRHTDRSGRQMGAKDVNLMTNWLKRDTRHNNHTFGAEQVAIGAMASHPARGLYQKQQQAKKAGSQFLTYLLKCFLLSCHCTKSSYENFWHKCSIVVRLSAFLFMPKIYYTWLTSRMTVNVFFSTKYIFFILRLRHIPFADGASVLEIELFELRTS